MAVIKNREELGRARRSLLKILVERLDDWSDMESLSEVAKAHGASFISVGRGDTDTATGKEQVMLAYEFDIEKPLRDQCYAAMIRRGEGDPVGDDANPIICRRDWEEARAAADEEGGE